MPTPEPLARIPNYPVTALTCVAAIGVTLLFNRNPASIESLTMAPEAFTTQPWRLISSALPHVGLLHLCFNVYWTWTLGAQLERLFGHLRYLAFILLAAAFSSAADWALESGGVGLSGVGYAMFGVLWALRNAPNYRSLMDQRTAALFITWFFICIISTALGYMNVANTAHGAGALFGFAVGRAIAAPAPRRTAWTAAIVALMLLSYLGATSLRSRVNLSNLGLGDARVHIDIATEAIARDQHDKAIKHMRFALKKDPSVAQWWGVLASQLSLAGDTDAAREALQQGLALNPKDPDLLALQRYLTHSVEVAALIESSIKAINEERHEDAIRVLERAVEIDDQNASWWASLGVQYYYAGNVKAARKALERSIALDASDKELTDFLSQLRELDADGN